MAGAAPLRLFEKGFAGVDGVKLENRRDALPTKIRLREGLWNAMVEGADPARHPIRVFDAYAGKGELHNAVWSKADLYVGCDTAFEPLRGDTRKIFCADNRRVLRVIDLSPFNIFDLDAFGSPWEPALIISARRTLEEGELIGFAMTDGSGRTLKANQVPKGIRMLAGLGRSFAGIGRWHEQVITRCLHGMGLRMNGKVVRRWGAKGRTGLGVRYIAVVFQGKAASEPSEPLGKFEPQEG